MQAPWLLGSCVYPEMVRVPCYLIGLNSAQKEAPILRRGALIKKTACVCGLLRVPRIDANSSEGMKVIMPIRPVAVLAGSLELKAEVRRLL